MAKKVWISIPLVTASEANDAAVVSFLKGGLKKELEVETAAFITKWMSDKNVPFHVAVESSSPERNPVVTPAPQGAPDSVTIPVVAETDKAIRAEGVAEHSEGTTDAAGEQVPEGVVATEHAGEQAEAVPDEPAPQLNPSGGVEVRRARVRTGRRVPGASKAEE